MTLAFSIFVPFEWLADAFVRTIGLPLDSTWGAAIAFFVYEIGKVSVLIFAISWLMALVRRALPVEAMRLWLRTPTGRILGYPSAAMFGAMTPFCSCSSVPLFIGFIEARLPVGIALAFLITSPLVNEIVVALFIASFGWKVTSIYVIAGVSLGVIGGWVLQRVHAERWLTDFAQRKPAKTAALKKQPMVFHASLGRGADPVLVGAGGAYGCSSIPLVSSDSSCCGQPSSTTGREEKADSGQGCGCEGAGNNGNGEAPSPEAAVTFANREAREIYFGVLPYLTIALVIGAGIHGFVPEQALAAWFAVGRWWDVPAAVVLGFPLYASANATVPVLETLVAKGVPLGTGMAFIMAAVGVSVPELVILKRVMTTKLLVTFSLTVSLGVILVGFLFNALF